MILSSCGCKVSWALREGVRLLREPRRLFRLIGDTHSLKMRCNRRTFRNCRSFTFRRPLAGKIHRILPALTISKSADFSMGTVVRYQSITLCRKCNKCRKFRFHAVGFTMIFTSAGLPTDWRSGSSSRMYPCLSSSSSVGKISSVFLKNFPRHI